MRVMLNCTVRGCSNAASWALIGEDLQRYGPFCRKHGMNRLEALQVKEDESQFKGNKAKR